MKHQIRSVGSIAFESLSGGDYKAKLPQKEDEYIATWDCTLQEAKRRLKDEGYSYQMFAARKFLDGYGRDDGSYAKIDPDDQTKQYHVHLYDTDDGVEVYSHWEYRIVYPLKHYNAKEYVKGKTTLSE